VTLVLGCSCRLALFLLWSYLEVPPDDVMTILEFFADVSLEVPSNCTMKKVG
jgi:hypothetical protein